ncbi:hypothetical protein ACFP1G_04590 [Levilactobacillus tongjiangensis]|uniref:Uncharacterized protein n=1 Tax=Levilactobacillus tongjiangensis TaxID=2486023 RepID=A0ABW1SQF4_9LACO
MKKTIQIAAGTAAILAGTALSSGLVAHADSTAPVSSGATQSQAVSDELESTSRGFSRGPGC